MTSICHGSVVLKIYFASVACSYVLNFVILRILFIMAALYNRAGHYIFVLWFLSIFFFSSLNLSGRIMDVYHTSTHDVVLVRI